MSSKITITDVARTAGVSVATVSRTLSNPGLVSEDTRRTVFEAIRASGYRVNHAARNLRKQRAGAVLVLVPTLANPFFSHVLAGITAGFQGSDYSVLVADTATQDRRAIVESYVLDARIDGLISLDGGLAPGDIAGIGSDDLSHRVVFACEWSPDPEIASVRCDNEEGARLAIRYLAALGHTAIAHVTGPEGNVLTHARRSAMQAERQLLGLPARPDWIIRGDFSLQSGAAAAERILAMPERPTAVFCAADTVAFGLISALTARGISVPGDISVVGFDDIEMSRYYVPALTTIRQDRWRIGRHAAELLLARLEGGSAPPADTHRQVEVELVVRGSTAPPPA